MIGDRLLFGYATANAAAGTPDPLQGRRARFRERFREFGGAVPEVLRTLERDDQLIHGDIEEVKLARWAEGCTVLLGDAAHAMTPNLGQGAAMAMEDAWALSEALGEEPSIERALDRYEARRRRRVERLQNASRAMGRIGQWGSPLACAVRDAMLPGADPAVGGADERDDPRGRRPLARVPRDLKLEPRGRGLIARAGLEPEGDRLAQALERLVAARAPALAVREFRAPGDDRDAPARQAHHAAHGHEYTPARRATQPPIDPPGAAR